MIIQTLSTADWNLFLRWAQAEGWRVPHKEQHLFQNQWRPYFFALRHQGNTCGFVSAVSYRHSGWIGNLLIDPEQRGRGYGKYLFEESLRFLGQRPLQRLWLTASEQGQPLYQRYQFNQIDTVIRWSASGQGNEWQQSNAALHCLSALEQDCWGEDRGDLLRATNNGSLLLQQKNNLALLQTGIDVWQLGPWSAAQSDPPDTRRLLESAIAATPQDKSLFIDTLHSAGLELMLRQAGFKRHGHNSLMCRSENPPRLRGVMALASFGSIG